MAPKKKRDYSKLSQTQLRRLEKNPGERSKIPTNLLSPDYKAKRVENTRLNAPVTPGSSYTNRQAAQERNRTVDQRYGPALQQSTAQQAAIPGYYDQMRTVMQAAEAARQQGFAQANQQFQALQAGTGAAQGQQAQQAYQAQTAALGGQTDPALAQQAANAAGIRQANAGSLGGVFAAQGANAGSYAASQYANTGKSQLEDLQKELDTERKLKLEKGAFAAETDRSIVDRERKTLMENKAFDLTAADKAIDNQTQQQQLDLQRRGQDKTAASQAAARRAAARARGEKMAGPGGTYTAKEWREMSPAQRTKAAADYARETRAPRSGRGGGQGAPRQEPASSIGVRRGINARTETVRKYMRDNNIPVRPGDGAARARLVAALRQTHPGYFANPNEEYSLRAAIDLATGGAIQRPTVRYLRRQGVYVTTKGDYYGAGNRGS